MAVSDPQFQAGDVVVVPFSYSDRFAKKRRPALVVSSSAVEAIGYVWVVMITNAKHARLAHDRLIGDLRAAGLEAPSVVRPIKIACFDPPRILRKAGAVPGAEMAVVAATLKSFIGQFAERPAG